MRLLNSGNSTRVIYTLRHSRLVQNVGWLTGAEMLSRLGRIVTAIVLARTMGMAAFGVAAIAITIFELTRIFTENGIGAAVIRTSDKTLSAVANTAYRMMWAVCLLLAFIQASIGLYIAAAFPQTQIGWMVCTLASVYLIMPFGLVHAYMLIRQERMKRLAIIASSQTLVDHLLTALLAVLGFGAWAIVLPKVLTTPIWLIGVSYDRPWQRIREAGFYPTRSLLHFSAPVLLSELAVAAREQVDKLLVSTLFGLEALGLYYFAFNAGLGLSTALNRALSAALYPILCAQRETRRPLKQGFKHALTMAGLPLACIYLLQAGAALIYVPILFGPDWRHAAPLVALLCLGGPARLLLDSLRVFWRASGKTLHEFKLSFVFAAGTLLPILVFASAGLYAASLASVISATVTAACLAIPLLAQSHAHTPNRLQGEAL